MAEQDPHALPLALEAWAEAAVRTPDERDHVAVDALRAPLRESLRKRLVRPAAPPGLAETTPGVEAGQRLARAAAELLEVCDGFLRREAIAASITPAERREMLRGMVLTRAVDNRLKAFFTGSEVQYNGVGFQGRIRSRPGGDHGAHCACAGFATHSGRNLARRCDRADDPTIGGGPVNAPGAGRCARS